MGSTPFASRRVARAKRIPGPRTSRVSLRELSGQGTMPASLSRALSASSGLAKSGARVLWLVQSRGALCKRHLRGGGKVGFRGLELLACPSASALGRLAGVCPGASRVSIRERSGMKARLNLPWSLSRVDPRALGQEIQHKFALEPLACPSASARAGEQHEFNLEPLACPSASAQAGRPTGVDP